MKSLPERIETTFTHSLLIVRPCENTPSIYRSRSFINIICWRDNRVMRKRGRGDHFLAGFRYDI